MSPRTRAIIVNTPHNPSATVWTDAEMAQLQDLLDGTDVVVISDEVYEHMVFDGAVHQSAARFPALAARSFIVSSFGKTYHVTGWKVGYVAAPAPLSAEFRKVHQLNSRNAACLTIFLSCSFCRAVAKSVVARREKRSM